MLAASITPTGPERTGYADAPGGRIWWRMDGVRHLKSSRVPLIAIHGGPGGAHDYLLPLTRLSEERTVILYDQLDCGESDKPDNPNNWNVDRFVAEVDALRKALEIDRCILFGHSWGGLIAVEYATRNAPGLQGAIFACPLISTARWVADNAAHRTALPVEVQITLDRHEAAGTTSEPEYQAALGILMKRHFCRASQEPLEITRLFRKLNSKLYRTLWGADEFVCTGTLKDYDGSILLPRIGVPCLFVCGEYDQSTPAANRDYASLTPDCKVSVIPGASHMPMFENPTAFLTALRWFCGT
ncbi:MAG TPA: proline iminopeptidase-family hydrolase [Dongiaceae bacterium]|jgi:proline iminopeptidase|nr:proline iminopeptidase-family hydrolase [Dongiaceae bacterium]